MMEVDIWRAANILIEQHGGLAGAHAEMKADQLSDDGDKAGASAWRNIAKAIDTLLRTTPDGRTH
jgi:hypothetical protein